MYYTTTDSATLSIPSNRPADHAREWVCDESVDGGLLVVITGQETRQGIDVFVFHSPNKSATSDVCAIQLALENEQHQVDDRSIQTETPRLACNAHARDRSTEEASHLVRAADEKHDHHQQVVFA